MTVSFVLRLVNDSLLDGHVVGQAENIATGERRVVGDADELLDFLRASTLDEDVHTGVHA